MKTKLILYFFFLLPIFGFSQQKKSVKTKPLELYNYVLSTPNYEKKENQKLEIIELYQTKNLTNVKFTNPSYFTLHSDKNNLLYIYDTNTQKKYYAKEFFGLPLNTNISFNISSTENVSFVIGFEKTPNNLKIFDIYEGDNAINNSNNWFIKNVNFTNSTKSEVNSYLTDFKELNLANIEIDKNNEESNKFSDWYAGYEPSYSGAVRGWIDYFSKVGNNFKMLSFKFTTSYTIVRLKLNNLNNFKTFYKNKDYRCYKMYVLDYKQNRYISYNILAINKYDFNTPIYSNNQYIDLIFPPIDAGSGNLTIYLGEKSHQNYKDYMHFYDFRVYGLNKIENPEEYFQNHSFVPNKLEIWDKISQSNNEKFLFMQELGDGFKFSGYLVNGKIEGFGRWDKDDKSWYEGEFKNGKENGKGTLRTSDGLRYVGNFTNGLPNGKFLIERWTLGGLVSDKWEATYNNGSLINSNQTESSMTDFLSGKNNNSISSVTSKSESLSNSNNLKTSKVVKFESEGEVSVMGTKTIKYFVKYEDGTTGYLYKYYQKDGGKWAVYDGLAKTWEYSTKEEAIIELYKYKN